MTNDEEGIPIKPPRTEEEREKRREEFRKYMEKWEEEETEYANHLLREMIAVMKGEKTWDDVDLIGPDLIGPEEPRDEER